MQYEQLSEEVRIKLEETGRHIARYSAAANEPNNKVTDAIRLSKDSEADINKFEGYTLCSARTWFEFVTDNKSEEEAIKMVKEALGIFE